MIYYEEMNESEFNKAGSQDQKDEQRAEQPKSADRIGEFLQWTYEHPFTDIAAELELEKYKLLTPLEETGILPKNEEPNPYGPDESPNEYEQWWEAHPDEQQAFLANITWRDRSLHRRCC